MSWESCDITVVSISTNTYISGLLLTCGLDIYRDTNLEKIINGRKEAVKLT